jgi:hypothetical protein
MDGWKKTGWLAELDGVSRFVWSVWQLSELFYSVFCDSVCAALRKSDCCWTDEGMKSVLSFIFIPKEVEVAFLLSSTQMKLVS